MRKTQEEKELTMRLLLTPHFCLGEFIRSGTAIKQGIDNTPTDLIVLVRLTMLCEMVLEPLRLQFGIIRITSGFRCKQLNLAVGGASGSQHCLGEAADIFIPNQGTLQKYVEFIKEKCDFDQMILEPRGQPQKRWLHVSYTTRKKNRKMILT